MGLDPDALRQLDAVLRRSKQVLVEINDETRWERPELALTRTRVPPRSGYALASSTLSRVRHEKHPYVTDVNHGHQWRRVEAVYPTMDSVARTLGVQP